MKRITKFQYPFPIPEYRPRDEYSVEKILHKAKVLARKRQIELARLDIENCGTFQPLSLPQYQTPAGRKQVLKYLLTLTKNLLP